MKAITVHQPWAWAMFALELVGGPKDVENRSQMWHHRGDLAVIAGRRAPDVVRRHRVEQLAGVAAPPDYQLPRGFVLGVVDLVDVHWSEPGCCSSRWAEERPYVSRLTERRVARVSHLVLQRPRPLLEPVPAVGFLGIRNLSRELGGFIEALVA